ncbi:MAG TPA: tRNA (N6-threonylcarbamoyladenosine(37)-N6)-methyltransferase TrmO [Methanomicrobia archaeon]|nr:tRNA (N6-threonylcarbamoyladenosine(37)-N6)-methyltransferase TrmO [Methanomicrobia archaeon]
MSEVEVTEHTEQNAEPRIKQIGTLHTPYKRLKEVPYQSSLSRSEVGSEVVCEIEVFEEYAGGLKDIEGFSHLFVLYWLHKSKGYSLLVRTPWDSELHGLFTTRSPNRPNPIGISVVRLLGRGREGKQGENFLRVSGIDAVDGTPLVDLKPFVPAFDEKGEQEVRVGWLESIGWLESRIKK